MIWRCGQQQRISGQPVFPFPKECTCRTCSLAVITVAEIVGFVDDNQIKTHTIESIFYFLPIYFSILLSDKKCIVFFILRYQSAQRIDSGQKEIMRLFFNSSAQFFQPTMKLRRVFFLSLMRSKGVIFHSKMLMNKGSELGFPVVAQCRVWGHDQNVRIRLLLPH